MKDLNPRIHLADGASLSVQANQYAYCSPRIDGLPKWQDYRQVEVGFIYSKGEEQMTPPESWKNYSDGSFPSTVYGYVPVSLVEAFIAEHGGAIDPVFGAIKEQP